MTAQEAATIISQHRDALAALGVAELYVFGSTARNEATSTSDVDVLVRLTRPMGWEFLDIQPALESWLGCAVDVTTLDGLRASVRSRVLLEAVRAA